MDTDFNVLYESEITLDCHIKTFSGERLVINATMDPGLYVLSLSGAGWDTIYNYSIYCQQEQDEFIPNSKYLLVYDEKDWLSAKEYCELNGDFGYSLATIASEADMQMARYVIFTNNMKSTTYEGIWMGMFGDIFNNTAFQSLDGTPLNNTLLSRWIDKSYSSINDTIYPVYWYINVSSSMLSWTQDAYQFPSICNGM